MVDFFAHLTTALDNSVVNPILANQKGITFSANDKWTDPSVALLKEKHYTRIGLWTSLAISKTIVRNKCIHFNLDFGLPLIVM